MTRGLRAAAKPLTKSSRTPGRSWRCIGVPPLSPTATSRATSTQAAATTKWVMMPASCSVQPAAVRALGSAPNPWMKATPRPLKTPSTATSLPRSRSAG